MEFHDTCPVCSSTKFSYTEVLWPELIDSWELTPNEIDYINRQQGLFCTECNNNLRSMALANAITFSADFSGNLIQFIESDSAQNLSVLEINEAGGLTAILQNLSAHKIVRYPEFDMTNLTIASNSFDLVIHSDTLEHVSNPKKGLSECYRVLKPFGKCIFTVPILIERMTRSRTNLTPSYHGQSGVPAKDQLVHTEFGADVWQTIFNSGFHSCEIFSLEYPSGLSLIAKKEGSTA